MEQVIEYMSAFIAQTNTVQVSFDRTLATISATFVFFLIGQLLVAIKWGGKVGAKVDEAMKRLEELTHDVAEMRKALTSIAVSEERLESHALRLQDHDLRLRTLEQMQWKYEGRRSTDEFKSKGD